MNVSAKIRPWALLLLAILVRLIPLGRYVTPDEPIWVYRSVLFRDAVLRHDWAAIPQTGHPGITTMALGALGIQAQTMWHTAESQAHLAWIRNLAWLAPENSAAFHHLNYFLPAGRLAVVGVSSLGVMLAYLLARARLDERTARLLAVFLALDPFYIGHSALLHTDALQATFGLLAALTLLPRRDGRHSWRRLLLAGAWLALAGLSKTLGLLLAPGLALALLMDRRSPWAERGAQVLGLACATVIGYALLNPPLWGSPRHALEVLTQAVSYHESIGLRPVYFAGHVTTTPDARFYPAVLLWRLTPPVLLGLSFLLMRGASAVKGSRGLSSRFTWPALIYLLAITLPDKKFDRYALSAILLLTVPAARAWAAQRWWRWSLPLLLLPWATVTILPLYEADPLLGGPWVARHVIPLGWGEASGLGASLAARELPDPQAATLLSDNVPGTAPFFPGRTLPWREDRRPCADALLNDRGATETLRWAGLPLTTITIRTARWPSGTLIAPAHLPGLPDEAVAPQSDASTLRAWLAQRLSTGEPFHWVQASACDPLTEAQLAELLAPVAECSPPVQRNQLPVVTCTLRDELPPGSIRARFGGDLDLLAAAWPPEAHAPDALAIQLRWRPQAPPDRRTAYLTLSAGGLVWAEGGGDLVNRITWPSDRWPAGEITEGTTYIPLPLDLPPGTYTATLSLFDAHTKRLGIWQADGTFRGTSLRLGPVTITPAPYPAEASSLPPREDALAGLRLTGAALPTEATAGDRLSFRLSWERTAGSPPDRITWGLACEGARDGGRLPLAPGNPASWPMGYRYETRYAPRTSPRLPGGACALTLAVGDAPPLTLGTVKLRRREANFSFPHPPQTPLTVTVGTFGWLRGGDWPAEVQPGATFSVTLFWQAQGAADADYTVFVHLLGADGHIWGQSDRQPAEGHAPTSSWLAGQVIADTHRLTPLAGTPPGTYTITVGLYDAESGGRIPLRAADGALLPDARAQIGTITVGRAYHIGDIQVAEIGSGVRKVVEKGGRACP